MNGISPVAKPRPLKAIENGPETRAQKTECSDRESGGGTHSTSRPTPFNVHTALRPRVVDEATWLMARARAVLDGRRPPAPPHDLQRRGDRGEPAIELDEHEHPVYVGSEAPFRTGWFAAGGGLFGGLLMGTMLGGFGGWVDEGGFASDSDGGPEGAPKDW
jgi:hypothetical protein